MQEIVVGSGEEQSIASVFESEAHTPYVVKCLLFSFLIFTPPVAGRRVA